jgi:Lrp/AsnC family transcriptional regulator for asnA, asnC and gidA
MATDGGFDKLDIRILQQLQTDGRMPFTRIADILGVSEGTVRARVSRLTRSRMVKVVADADPKDLGLVEVYLGLRIQGPALERAVEQITRIPEIPYVAVCSGTFDILCEVICRNNDDLLRLLQEVRKIPGISHIETLTVLKIQKEDWRYKALAKEAAG